MITPKRTVTAAPSTPVPFVEAGGVDMGQGAEQLETVAALTDIKEELKWPIDVDGVIDLEELEEENELKDMGSSDSSLSSSSSSSETDSDVEVQLEEPVGEDTTHRKEHFMNTSSLVIHRRKTALVFHCGRKISSSYVPVTELMGYRGGTCFHE